MGWVNTVLNGLNSRGGGSSNCQLAPIGTNVKIIVLDLQAHKDKSAVIDAVQFGVTQRRAWW